MMNAAEEALAQWTREETLARIDARWTPGLMRRFAEVVREVLQRAPEEAKRAGLVPTARGILRGDEATRAALGRDPALGRWTTAVEGALMRGDALAPWLALVPRFRVATALLSGERLECRVVLGSGGRARVPVDGRVLQGPPGRPLGVVVQDGELLTHARAPREASGFEVADGDAEAGATPEIQPLSGGSLSQIVRPLAEGVACLRSTAAELAEEIATLAPVLVAVRGSEEVSHSASLSEARGCIWLTPVTRPLVVAETLVHEASHLKFFLAEDVAPFVEVPDVPRFEVPWRSDLRPLRAVLMGLHAWVRVLDWLATLAGGPLQQPAAERSRLLGEATAAAAAIVTGAEGLTAEGRALVAALCARDRDR